MRSGDRTSQRNGERSAAIVRVVIKETRRGNLAVRSEVDGPTGPRGPTDAERKACELHNKILDRIDESGYESGDVIADILVPDDGEPWIDWNDELVSAAGNDPHIAADGGRDRPVNGTEQQVIEGMEELTKDARGGAVIDLLPKKTDETVAIGLSVAVDALHDRNEEVAKAALEIAANGLEGRSLHPDRGDGL